MREPMRNVLVTIAAAVIAGIIAIACTRWPVPSIMVPGPR